MAITYGTLLGMVVFPVIIFNTFLDRTNGALWLNTIETRQSHEDKQGAAEKKYYPTFLNVLIATSKAFNSKDPRSNQVRVSEVPDDSNILDYDPTEEL